MSEHTHTCPVWAGYLLASPLRKLFQNPKKILAPYVEPNMTVLDIGSAMGFFSIPLAEMVAPEGTVICVDMQEKMLDKLRERAFKACVAGNLVTNQCFQDSLALDGLDGSVDFALAFAVVHEVSDKDRLFSEIHTALKPEARLFIAEPKGHVDAKAFEATVEIAEDVGFKVLERPEVARSRAVVMAKV